MTDAPKPQADEPHDVSADAEAVQAEPAIESHDPEVSPEAVAQPVDADLIQVDGEPEPVVEVIEEPIPVDTRVQDADYVEAVEADVVEAAALVETEATVEPMEAVAADTVIQPAESLEAIGGTEPGDGAEPVALDTAIEPVDYAHQPSPELDPIIEAGSLEPAISLPLSEPISEPVTESLEEAPAVTTEPEAEPVAAEADTTSSDAAVLGTAAVVGAAAVGAAAAASDGRRPIWSDQGDAPFNDGPEKPIYDRRERAKSKGKAKTKGGDAGSEAGEIVKTVVFALLIAFVLRVLLFQPFTIPSASMEPNLYEGDYIVVTKWSYGYSRYSIPFAPPLFEGRLFAQAPERGDVVVFKLPRDNRTDYIKRLIGLPGDRIQMVANKLYINGQPVDDVVVSQSQVNDIFGPRPVSQVRETLPGGKVINIQDFGPGNELDDTPVYQVPAGHYFMMGDNRDNSIDSRVEASSGVGLVPAENLVGKAQIILFSWSPGASFWKPWTWFSNLRPSRFFTVLN